MLSIGMHCRLLGRPGACVALQRFLDHIATHDRVWVCRRIDIARHWKHPPFRRHRLGLVDHASDPGTDQRGAARRGHRAAGRPYEHSPWIAEAAPGAAAAVSLAGAPEARMVQVVRDAGREPSWR
jgi:hypothetical protein